MIRPHRAAAWMALAAISCSGAYAGEIAGMIKTRTGEVTVERAGQRLPADIGMTLEVADRVRTGLDGTVGMTLRDNTLLSAGPRSTVVIRDFAYDTTTQAGRVSVGVQRGTLSVASGKIAKQTPASVEFHTPTSVLGVRGTEFVIEVEGSDE